MPLLLSVLLCACAAQAPAPAPVAPVKTVIRAAQMLDVRAGKLVARPQIVVSGRTIESVGKIGDPVPAGAAVIDLGEKTLVPGLMDMHTHLTDAIEGDWVNRPVHDTAADAALHGAHNARVTLLAGFTTVRDVGSSDLVDVALMKSVETRRDRRPVDLPRRPRDRDHRRARRYRPDSHPASSSAIPSTASPTGRTSASRPCARSSSTAPR